MVEVKAYVAWQVGYGIRPPLRLQPCIKGMVSDSASCCRWQDGLLLLWSLLSCCMLVHCCWRCWLAAGAAPLLPLPQLLKCCLVSTVHNQSLQGSQCSISHCTELLVQLVGYRIAAYQPCP